MRGRSDYARLEAVLAAAWAAHLAAEAKLLELGKQLAPTDPNFCPTCGARAHRIAPFDGPDGDRRERRSCRSGHRWTVVAPKPSRSP